MHDLKPATADKRPEVTDSKPKKPDFRPARAYLRSRRIDNKSERADFRHGRKNFRSERADFRSERAWGERMDGRMDGMTNESPPVFYRTLSPSGPLPKNIRWSEVSMPCLTRLWLRLRGSRAPRDWNLGLGVGIWALRVGFGPQDWDLGLQAGIWASRLEAGGGG